MRHCALVYGIALGFFGQGMADAEGVDSSLRLNQQNLLFSNNTVVPPPDFKVIIDADKDVPLFQEAVFRTAINVMYDLTGFPLSHPWRSRDWTTDAGGAPEGANLGFHVEPKDFGGKEPSRLSTQYLMWGLNHLLLAMNLSGQFCQTTAILRWQGTTIGVIYVARWGSLALTPNSQTSNSTNALQLARQQLHRSTSSSIDVEDIEISIRYRGNTPIDRQLIYLTGLKAISDAAELGLERPIPGVYTQGLRQVHWKLGGGTQAFTGVMKPAYSRVAVVKTLAAMIEDKRFQEIDIWLKIDGLNTGIGGFGRGRLLKVDDVRFGVR